MTGWFRLGVFLGTAPSAVVAGFTREAVEIETDDASVWEWG